MRPHWPLYELHLGCNLWFAASNRSRPLQPLTPDINQAFSSTHNRRSAGYFFIFPNLGGYDIVEIPVRLTAEFHSHSDAHLVSQVVSSDASLCFSCWCYLDLCCAKESKSAPSRFSSCPLDLGVFFSLLCPPSVRGGRAHLGLQHGRGEEGSVAQWQRFHLQMF